MSFAEPDYGAWPMYLVSACSSSTSCISPPCATHPPRDRSKSDLKYSDSSSSKKPVILVYIATGGSTPLTGIGLLPFEK